MRRKDPAHLSRVAALGCIVCLLHYRRRTPAEVHHIRTGMGMGQRADDSDTIPLCPEHHRLGTFGVAFHAGPREWQKNFGAEIDLLGAVIRLLDGEDWASEVA